MGGVIINLWHNYGRKLGDLERIFNSTKLLAISAVFSYYERWKMQLQPSSPVLDTKNLSEKSIKMRFLGFVSVGFDRILRQPWPFG